MIVAIRRLFAALFGPPPKPAAVDACKCRCDGDPKRCRSRPGGLKVKRD